MKVVSLIMNKMNPRKKTVLHTEYDIYQRGIQTKWDIWKRWKHDPEAINYLKELFNPK